MKRKLLSTVVALSMTASMTMPVFAAAQNGQTSEVPVVGKIGRWNPDPTNPDGTGGGAGQDGEHITPNNPTTDINVTIPTSMTFNVVTNTQTSNPELATADYTVTNNGAAVNMSGKYDVTADGGITLVDSVDTVKGGDGIVQLALGLNAGDKEFIAHVTNGAKSDDSAPVALDANNGSTVLRFTADDAGMADIKAEAAKGTFKDSDKTTKGNLVLTFAEQTVAP